MIKIGEFNNLKIKLIKDGKCYLEGSHNDIILPLKELPKNKKKGDTIKVFVFNNEKKTLRATTEKPYAIKGQFAGMRVKDKTNFGIFLDWGISKDLFVPNRLLNNKDFRIGDTVIVKVVDNFDKNGVIGTCYIQEELKSDVSNLKIGQKVEVVVIGVSNLGYTVIIDDKYKGLLYKNEVYETLHRGYVRDAYIKKVREDGKVDVSLQKIGFKNSISDSSEKVYKALKDNNGFIPLNDKSSVEEIKNLLGMSKKNFKNTIGTLYRKHIIDIKNDGCYLVKNATLEEVRKIDPQQKKLSKKPKKKRAIFTVDKNGKLKNS